MFTACFVGQRFCKLDRITYNVIKSNAKYAITDNHVTEFLVGNRCKFDRVAASAVRSLKKDYPHIKLYLVVPKVTRKVLRPENEYDKILVHKVSKPRFCTAKKIYKYMIDESELVISYVEKTIGHSAQAERYAKKKNKTINDGFGIADVIRTVNREQKIKIK